MLTSSSKTSQETGETTQEKGRLQGNLGVAGIVFMVLAAAAPLAAVVANIPLVFLFSESSGAPLFVVLVGVILLFFSVGYTRMIRVVSSAGALFSYVTKGLGRPTGIGTASLALISYLCGFVSIIVYFGAAASAAVAHYSGLELPWWLGALVALLLVGFLGYRRVELSAKVLGVVLVLEVLLIVILNVAIISGGGDAGLTAEPFNPALLGSGAVGLGMLFAFGSFFGFEATAVFRAESRDPDRTPARATYIAIILIAIFYSVSAWALAIGAGVDKVAAAADVDPLSGLVATLTSKYLGPIFADILYVLLVTSFFACAVTFHNVVARYAFAMAKEEKALPAALGKVHPRFHSPAVASLITSGVTVVIVAVFAVLNLDPAGQAYIWLVGILTLGMTIMITLANLGMLAYFVRRENRAILPIVTSAISFIGLVAILAASITNFSVIVDGSVVAAVVIQVILLAVFIAGAIRAKLTGKNVSS